MTQYRAFYLPPATARDVLLADNKRFPLRDRMDDAMADLQNAWHDPPKDHRATQMTVYEIDGETVTDVKPRIQRRLVATGGRV